MNVFILTVLILLGIIVVALAAIVIKTVGAFRSLLTDHSATIVRANTRFLRDLDERARKQALATDDPFATIVRDEIDRHLDSVRDIRVKADAAQDKAAGKKAGK